jgi:hypothetical protein
MTALAGVQIPDKIVPFDSNDTHPTHDETYGLGGFRSVATIAARDAIPTERRAQGMLVYVIATNITYQLFGGITNANWIAYSSASSTTIFGLVTCDTLNFKYTVLNAQIPGPSAVINTTLRLPNMNSVTYTCSVTNVISGSFDIVLSDVPAVSGYLINWTLQNPS